MRTRLFVLLVCVLPLTRALTQNSDAQALKSQIVKAEQLLNGREFQAAIREFKRADEMAEGRSHEALIGLARGYRQTQEYNAAEDAALRAARVASNTAQRNYAYWTAAMAAMTQAEIDPDKYKDAEREFRAALQSTPDAGPFHTRYYLGIVLLRQSHDEEGVSELKKYISDYSNSRFGDSRLLKQAQDYTQNPNLARIARSVMPSPPPASQPTAAQATATQTNSPSPALNIKTVGDPTLRDHLLNGDALLTSHKSQDALKEFKTASKMAKDNSFEAWMGIAVCYQGLGAEKNAAEAALRAVPLAPDDVWRAHAHAIAGTAFTRLGADKPERYKDGERELRTALQLAPEAEFIHYYLGTSLLKQSRDNEGIIELQAYVAQHPNSTRVGEAQRMIDDPRRAREIFMPDFAITTIDGQYISSADLLGKVVVLDFWASWCGPCRSALGEIRSLAKHYAGKPVVVISISADTDKEKWHTFVQHNKMDWPQYLDEHRKILDLFGVHAFPTYLVVDSEGIVRRVRLGAGGFQVADIESEIKKALKRIEESQKKQAAGGGS